MPLGSIRKEMTSWATGRWWVLSDMPMYEIQHRWKAEHTKDVVEKVQNAAALAKRGAVPAGFRPISIVAIPNATEGHCIWEAPSREALEGLYLNLGVPTERTIREVTPFFIC
ncbi:MAG: hypothetical protein ACYDFT_00020 [Thermoplasmata archaeon]